MKSSWLRVLIFISVFGYIGYFVSCTQKDQILLTNPDATNSTTLVSLKVATAPTIDGTIEPLWESATKLKIAPTVPDPGNGLFAGYIGTVYNVNLRSMYDDKNIYFLAEWDDAEKSVFVSNWYFDPATKLWAQEPSSKVFDVNGNITRDGWGEDKMAMLWNVDASTPKFISQTCYASCHVFTPYKDNSGLSVSNANSGNHYTNGANEKIDMWWGHLGRDLIYGQMDDNFQDWAGGPSVTNLVGGSGNGRHVDGVSVTGASSSFPFAPTYSAAPDGAVNNRQTLTITGSNPAKSVTVPLYFIPGAANYYFIKQTDVDGGTAKRITAVDANGVLTYSGGTIDPSAGSDFQRIGDPIFGGTGPKSIPSYIWIQLAKGRADITCGAVHTGTGWIVEYQRALNTGDVMKQDINFESLKDQPFGFAVWNKSNNQHGIQPNLTLHFNQ